MSNSISYQQGEQSVVGWGLCCLLKSFRVCVGTSTQMDTSDVLGDFTHLLRSLLVLGHVRTKPQEWAFLSFP